MTRGGGGAENIETLFLVVFVIVGSFFIDDMALNAHAEFGDELVVIVKLKNGKLKDCFFQVVIADQQQDKHVKSLSCLST